MNRIRKARALFCLLLASVPLPAQEYSFRAFTNADGLNNLAVRRVFQDHTGFLWVSTENGIYRYDGERFEGFGPAQGLPDSLGASLGDAPDGSLLAGGSFGLYRLRGNRFESVTVPFKSISWRQGIQADGKGHTFLATESGLFELSSQPAGEGFALRQIPQPPATSGPEVEAVLADGEIVWFGCGQSLCRMDGNGTQVLGAKAGLPETSWVSILKDWNGTLWVRSRDKGLFVLAAGQERFRRPDASIPAEATIGVPGIDSEGHLLLPTPDGLLSF